ncbi:tetratricopeptide repeat protein [Micromonospora sp. DR5-3]|uniref:ATP-binding protein n=1 Tax=unclassified Micromonospora TaxID=2617518 RepID=UPI0011D92BEB|nr:MULTISPECIES: tetratricopeptide repeat protein [unclassified Micromonospora]MCW3816377.1 tetratricopeptide repeat protein [Micromonospora sp. DR5-3]TYC22749.1 tetratricopeptide repeat protein [Micromonospora sp. MP36]
MTASDFGVDPTTASCPAQYVALLRRVRDQSGLAYRAIARRAQRNGQVLPASTLATMLGRPTLPRRDLVVALLRACDVPDERASAWLTTWARLAAARPAGRGAAPGERTIAPGTGAPTPRSATPPPDPGNPVTDPHHGSPVLRLVPGTGVPRSEPARPGRSRVTGAGGPDAERAVPRAQPWPSPDQAAGGTRPPVPFQLPPAPPLIVGRGEETGQLHAATAQDGAVCVVDGAGGVGKSALALHVAHQIAARYDGGCLYADLHGASAGIAPAEPADVLARFLRALGAPTVPSSVEEASALLRTWAADRGMLVVLDDAASAAQIRPLLISGPGCATVVTSRWTLADLDATARIRLAPLPDDAALALLGRLGGAARVAAEPDAAAQVVRHCAGLPLALRIIGARVAARPDAPLGGLAERMDDEGRRLDLLEVGDLSMRASLHLGYQAFADAPQDERRRIGRLFRLAALPDWADATAYGCAALADLPVPVAERALEALVDAHLIESAGDGRYRFHDIVRLYARERAQHTDDPADREAALSRLTGWLFATTATAARLLYPQEKLPSAPSGPGQPLADTADAWAWFEREHTNLLMIARQQVSAGQTLTEVRDLALVVVKFIDYSGYTAEQQQFGHLAVEAAQRLGDRSGTAMALNIVAVALLRQGRHDEAIPLLARNLAVQRELGDRAREAACLNNLGNALRDKGDLDGALRQLRAALAIRRELGDRHKEGSVLDNLALVHQRRGEFQQAVDHHQAGLAIAAEGTDPLWEAQALVNFAETLQLAGGHEAAVGRATESLEICRRYRHQRGIGLALRVLGDAYASLGRAAEARRHWREALARLDGLDREACAKLRAALGGDGATDALHPS